MNTLPPSLVTELKLNITAELGNNLHLADVGFSQHRIKYKSEY